LGAIGRVGVTITVLATGMGMVEFKGWLLLDGIVGEKRIWLNSARFSSIVVRLVDVARLAK